MNVKAERLLQLVTQFDSSLGTDLRTFIEGARRDSIDAVVDLRNKISHGESVSLTYHGIRDYYRSIVEVVEFLEARLV